MRLILAALCMSLAAGLLSAETPPQWTGAQRDLDSGSHRGSATISADKQSVALGEPFSVDIRFLNSGAGGEFYSPFLSGQTPLPARLAIFNSDHKYLGDLFDREGVQRRAMLSAEDWTFVPTLCWVGRAERLTAGYVPATSESGSRSLPPGEYDIQLIYFKALLATNPAKLERKPLEDAEKVFRRFERDFDRAELFRSNALRIRFTAK